MLQVYSRMGDLLTCASHALTVQKRLIEHYIPQITSVEYEGAPVEPPRPVEWFPDKLAWSMTTPKNVIRRFPPFASFQKFLVSENSVGNITRQEIVSMIPPLLLDVRPGMTVLDLCAAPGSKSAQLIEMVHGGEEARVQKVIEEVAASQGIDLSTPSAAVEASKEQAAKEDDYSDDGRATGLLIANDVEYRRAQMLVHQCKRLNSPNLIVTNHDAILFPSIKIPSEFGQRYLKFDRILADVPCSGDGTCRKNPEIWKDWLPSKALGLHVTQVRILVRALQMLKVGGRVVYSTCSMNPIENEAVIASAIERCGGSRKVKLIDQSEALPGLERKHGLSEWKVMDKKGRWWNSWDEAVKSKEDSGEEGMSKLVEGMFPPKPEDESIPLDRCIRIYPHLQDTGGFFITVLEKQSEIKARPENQPKVTPNTTSSSTPATGPTSSSIMAVVNEIQAATDKEANGLSHVTALDDILPPPADHSSNVISGNIPATVRQNQENLPTNDENVTSRKRAMDDEADAAAAASAKRVKAREEPDEVAEEGAEDRQVHYPPPPGAQLETTEHHHDDATAPTGNKVPTNGTTTSTSKPATKPNNNNNQGHEEPFKFISPAHAELSEISTFYSLSSRFPRDRFMVRNATGVPVKSIYYTSALARDILIENEGKGIKFVHCGVKMFVKQDVQNQVDACKWRIQSEGLPLVEMWVGEERVVRCWERGTLRRLLVEMFPKVSGVGWKELGEVGERVRELGMGCCVLRVELKDKESGEVSEKLVMPLWRGLGSVNLMLPKEERKAMLLRLYNDETPLIDHSKEKREREAKAEKAAEEDDDAMDTKEDQVDGAADDADDVPFTVGGAEEQEEQDEDGGVALPKVHTEVNAAAEQAGIEEKAQAKEDLLLAQAQQIKDSSKEMPGGVQDEKDEFNTTV